MGRYEPLFVAFDEIASYALTDEAYLLLTTKEASKLQVPLDACPQILSALKALRIPNNISEYVESLQRRRVRIKTNSFVRILALWLCAFIAALAGYGAPYSYACAILGFAALFVLVALFFERVSLYAKELELRRFFRPVQSMSYRKVDHVEVRGRLFGGSYTLCDARGVRLPLFIPRMMRRRSLFYALAWNYDWPFIRS